MVAHRIGLAVVLALAHASLAAAEVKTVDRTLPLTATGTVSLDAHNGRIQIRTWDRPQVEVHVRIDWPGLSASSYRVRETTVDISGSADRVSITWNPPDRYGWSLWSLFEGPWTGPDVSYAITAPRTARLEIRNHNAEMDIRDTNAAVRIWTHNGAVRVTNLAGPIELAMHNGWARVEFASFSQDSRIATHNGTVELALPAASKFTLDSSGHHTSVNSDFALTKRASYDTRPWRHLTASVNGGGPSLQVTSHNANVRLQSR
jgi:hypothetical protein